jgi:hypothetical protein
MEKAPTAVIPEAYVQGSLTRSVDDLVKAMGAIGSPNDFCDWSAPALKA